jgi:intein/homing endonuclease
MNLFDVYVQYSVCWVAGTPVIMADGQQMPIESIEVGQQVLSHIGQAKTVTKVLRRPALAVLRIVVDGDSSAYRCTPEHPIFTRRGFVAANELQVGDYVGTPIQVPGSQPIDIDPELLGNLVGGFHYSAREAAVCVVLDWSRTKYVDSLANRCSMAGCEMEIVQRRNQGTSIEVRRLPIWVQQAVKNHILPPISWTDDEIIPFIRGLIDSVGSLDGAGYRMGFRRRDMADIVRKLAARVGILLDIYYHSSRKAWYLRTHGVNSKRVIDTVMSKWGKPIPPDATQSLGLLIADGYIWSRIAKVLPMAPKDQVVYNLEVEDDHSYVVGSMGSHNCEGWGMPITEAKSLGIPTMCVNYSAMEDHVKSTGGIAIDVGRYYYESLQQTEQRRALPDNYDFGRKLTNIFRKSEAERKLLSQKIRTWVEEPIKVPGELRKLPRFSWEYTAAVWEHWLETIPIKDRTTTWDSPTPNLLPMPSRPPDNMTHTEFVHWIITNTIGKQWCRTPMADEWVRALNIGCRFVGPNKVPIDRQTVWNAFCDRVKAHNDFEQRRIGRDKFNALPTTKQYLTL